MTRVLIVDESRAECEMMTYILGADPKMNIAGCATSEAEAMEMIKRLRPDVVTMSLKLSDGDGIEATRIIMQTCPTPIVIVSAGEELAEAGLGMRAIEAGALALVKRPFSSDSEHHASSNALLRAVKSMAEVKVVRRWPKREAQASIAAAQAIKPARDAGTAFKLVAIGTSTGGPAALRELLEQLTPKFSMPVVIVQHMTHGFMSGFANWLSSVTKFPIEIAEHGTALASGRAYLAPDGFQMGISSNLRVSLERAPAEHGMCPSVSYMFRSIHRNFCPQTIAVLLTGMGKDGAQELKNMRDAGAFTIAQDRETSAVHGMPGEAIKLDAAMMIMSSREIGKMLNSLDAEHVDSSFFLAQRGKND
jgi:two-component system chemotaxis response regulator CheB